jgi:DNA-binding transcriptional LysR family regulator
MELRHLKYFVAVAEELHFTRAADRLHIAQPPLSQQIKQLEEELGTRLFERSKRQVELTTAGRAVLDEARRAIGQVERVVMAARRAQRGEVGELSVGVSSSAPYTTLPAILRTFRARYPAVRLTLYERSTEDQIAMLRTGTIDAGFVRAPSPADTVGLEIRPILREPLVVALPQGHQFGRRKQVAVSALKGAPFVLSPRHAAPTLYDQIVGLCRREGFEPQVAQEATQMQTIVSLVSAGLGVAIVPASIQKLHRARVLYRALQPNDVMTEMALIHDPANPSRVLDAFVELVEKTAHS